MTVYHGKSGKVDFSGAITSVLAWTLTVTGDVAESTVMGNNFKSFEPGFIDNTATTDANSVLGATIKVGQDTALKLYTDATHYFEISTAICTEQTETVSMTDVGKVSYSFTANDAEGPVYT